MIIDDNNVREAYEFINKADKEKLKLIFYKKDGKCYMESIDHVDFKNIKPEQYLLFRENINDRFSFFQELKELLSDLDAPTKLIYSVRDNAFCGKCKHELISGDKECPICGNRNIVFGKHLIVENNEIKCDCGSSECKSCGHTSFRGYGVTNYKCIKCEAISGIEGHYDDDFIDEDEWL